MKCEDYEEQIALLAGGELAEPERSEVERHLVECEECRALAAELGEVRELLGGLAQEPAPEEALRQVRSGVSGRIARPARRWQWAAVAAAAAVLVGVGIEWRNRPEVPPPPPLMVEPPEAPTLAEMVPGPGPSAEMEEAPMPPAAVVENLKPAVEPATATARAREPLVVKFLTDDPNIVIYWVAEESGG